MIKAILIDMDDTLIVNQELYARAETLLYGYLRNFGVLPQEAESIFAVTDKELFKIHGRSRKRLPASFEAVLRHFVPDADQEMVEIVRSFGEEVFTTIAKNKLGTVEAVDLLSANYPVYIVTAGDREVQEFRLENLSFKDKISGTYVVDVKNAAVFTEVAQKLGLKPDEIVVIGDSMKSDILPAVEAGMQAVWVEAFNSPLHDQPVPLPKERAYQFHSLMGAARHIVAHGTPAADKTQDAVKKKPSPPKPS